MYCRFAGSVTVIVTILCSVIPAQAEIRTTICRFPVSATSRIMPEIKVVFDSVTETALIEDKLILSYG